MKKFPFNQLKLLIQARNFQTSNKISENFNVFSTINKLTHFSENIKPFEADLSKKDSTNSSRHLSRKYSFFSKKYKNFPIKCKIKTNECGEKVAETYIAKKPSCVNIPPLSKDFTMNPEETCTKLQEKIVTYSPKPPECMPRMTQNCSKTKFPCPNALTKYLKTKGSCKEVYRGVETNDCKKKNSCSSVKKATYTGRDCALQDPCKTGTNQKEKPQTGHRKPKKILEDLITKLRSGKLMKPSGFLSEDLMKEACSRLNPKGASKKILTCVKNTSNREKSTEIKFGVQNSSTPYSSCETFFRGLEEAKSYEKEVFLNEESLRSNFKDVNSEYSIGGMSKIAKSKRVEDETLKKPEGEDKNEVKLGKKPRKRDSKRPKSKSGVRKRRRRPRWFSKIPIEPNIRGSVIFANGTAQELDDPCKILSVNFSASNLHPEESQEEFEPNEGKSSSVVQHMLDNYDYVVEKLTSNCVIDLKKKEETPKESEMNLHEDLGIKKDDSNTEKDLSDELYQPLEPIVRQKKISKLDKTVKCFTTTEIPNRPETKKRQKKVKKHCKTGLKPGSTNDLNNSLLDLNNFQSTISSDAFGKGYHARTTSNLLVKHKNEGRGEVIVAKSDSSFVKIKDISPIYESGDEKETTKLMSKSGLKRDLLLPGVTRPVTQKAAHLNLLHSKTSPPVSTAWRRNSGNLGKTKDKVVKKKVMGIVNDQDALEIKGIDYQQARMKSTDKSALSWRSKCDVERRPCPNQKKNYDQKADEMYPLPSDWDYEGRVPEEIARKWNTWECPKEKEFGCPVTSEDLKKGPPHKKPVSAAAINRCNLEECKNRLRCRRPVSRCRNTSGTTKPLGPGK